jgi:hypothetical protein
VIMEFIGGLTSGLNLFIIYGFSAFLTLLVILDRKQKIIFARPLILISWWLVVTVAVSWLLFHVVYMLKHEDGASRLVAFSLILSFLPVYVCAVVLLFTYPARRKSI